MKKEEANKPLERIEEIINWTFDETVMYYRDSTLSKKTIKKYKVGEVFRSQTFIEVSKYAGKPTTNCRFVFASSKAALFQTSPSMKKYGLHSINYNSYFKILDIHEEKDEDVTQIILLHIPYKGIGLFKQPSTKLSEQNLKEQDIIKKANENLKKCLQSETSDALNEKEWVARTSSPIGLDDKNKFLRLGPTDPLSSTAARMYSAIKYITNDLTDLNDPPTPKKSKKNIIICLDGTNNQYGGNRSNVLNLFRMLERQPSKQVTYYDPGVGTLGDPAYKTAIAKKVNKGLGSAFGLGLMKNVMEAYTFLMDEYEDGDKVFLFGFSRGAYTARVLAGFIKECGMLEKGAKNLLPYAKRHYLQKAPTKIVEESKTSKDQLSTTEENVDKTAAKTKEKKEKNNVQQFHSERSFFRSTYGKLLNHYGDPLEPDKEQEPNYQLRIHFLGLFDTVKSYGWLNNTDTLRNDSLNPSVLNVRHALAIDEKRASFHQMHWEASRGIHSCKEVWFPGDHSDVGGGHQEKDSGLAKIALKWMVHEAIEEGLKVDPERYGFALQKHYNKKDNTWTDLPHNEDHPAPNPFAMLHDESVKLGWRLDKLIRKNSELWKTIETNGHGNAMRTIKSEYDRSKREGKGKEKQKRKEHNPALVHESVLTRAAKAETDESIRYAPKNLGPIDKINPARIVKTKPIEDIFIPRPTV